LISIYSISQANQSINNSLIDNKKVDNDISEENLLLDPCTIPDSLQCQLQSCKTNTDNPTCEKAKKRAKYLYKKIKDHVHEMRLLRQFIKAFKKEIKLFSDLCTGDKDLKNCSNKLDELKKKLNE